MTWPWGWHRFAPRRRFRAGNQWVRCWPYLDRHVPVIASDAGEHGRIFKAGTAVLSNDPARWVEEAAALLAAPDRRQAMAEQAFAVFQRTLSAEAVTRRMAGILDTHAREYQAVAGACLQG